MFPGQSRQLRAVLIALGEMIVDTVLSHRRCSGRGRVLTTFFFKHGHEIDTTTMVHVSLT